MTTKIFHKDFELMRELESIVLSFIKNPYQISSYLYDSAGIEYNAEEALWAPVTEKEKSIIYTRYLEGFYKETDEEKEWRLNPIRPYTMLGSSKPVIINEIFRRPRYFHDLLTAIFNYFTAVNKKDVKLANQECSNAFKLYINHNIFSSPIGRGKEFIVKINHTYSGLTKDSSNVILDVIKDYYFEFVEEYISNNNVKKDSLDSFIHLLDQSFFESKNLEVLEIKIKKKLQERYEIANKEYKASEKRFQNSLWRDKRETKKIPKCEIYDQWSIIDESGEITLSTPDQYQNDFAKRQKDSRQYHNRLKEKKNRYYKNYQNFKLQIINDSDGFKTIVFSKTRIITINRKKWFIESGREDIYKKIKLIVKNNYSKK